MRVLVGRPLALVRVAVSMRLRGLVATGQDWHRTFDIPDPAHPPAVSGPQPLGKVEGGVRQALWDVRLGSRDLRRDGLIGYYLDPPTGTPDAYTEFTALSVAGDDQNPYLSQIGPGNYLKLRLTDDSEEPAVGAQQVRYLTMLIDPSAAVHGFTGLLPVATLQLPAGVAAPALRRMAYVFRAGPAMTPPDSIRLPQPAVRTGTWTWFDPALGGELPLIPADQRVNLTATAPLVREGWLKLTPDPPPKHSKGKTV
jgi:hypothetical protein